jgi:electron transfer flavoprotein alpha subunit
MESILCLLHAESDGSLNNHAFETLMAAERLASDFGGAATDVGLIGADVQAAADKIASSNTRRFLGVSGSDFAEARYATDASAVEALIRASGATLVVAAQTSRFARVLGGVAHRLGGRVDTHVSGIKIENGAPTITRWYYRQRMEVTLSRSMRPWIVAMDAGCAQPWKGAPGQANIETINIALDETARRSRVVGLEAPPADEQTIRPEAALLFVAGAGWTKKQADGKTHVPEAERLILDFLKRTKASLGGSKSLVDISGEGQAVLSFMTHLNQIGQTGATPRHPKGLATCCHGEEPHTVGWRFIAERRAVDRDPSCGWARGKADVLYVADAFEVVKQVNTLLANQD